MTRRNPLEDGRLYAAGLGDTPDGLLDRIGEALAVASPEDAEELFCECLIIVGDEEFQQWVLTGALASPRWAGLLNTGRAKFGDQFAEFMKSQAEEQAQ